MAKLQGTGRTSAIRPSWSLVAEVTAGNYYALAKQCFAVRGTAFLIALADGKSQGVDYRYTAKQWGAWLAFFRRIGLKHTAMLQREWWQVPTEWPHEFSSDATVQGDEEAGAYFERHFLAQRSVEKPGYGNAANRAVHAAKAKAKMRKPWLPPTPEEHLKVPPEPPPWHADASEEFRELIKSPKKIADLGEFA